MLRSKSVVEAHIPSRASFTISTVLLVMSQAPLSVALAAPLPEGSEQGAGKQQPDTQQEAPAEISIEADRQTALAKQAIIISETPDAGPQSKKFTAVVGAAPILAPAYLGSKKIKVGGVPYVDLHGIWGGRLYLSAVSGLGVNLVQTDSFRAGLNVNSAPGRKSKDDPHLKGLPDVKDAASLGGFVSYWQGPLAFQATFARRVGSQPGTGASVGASYNAELRPNLQLNISTSLTWADAAAQNTAFGISPADAIQAARVGNRLTPYKAGAGLLGVGATASAVYLLTDHWGLVGVVGLLDLIGNSAKDSPLTQRTIQPTVATGVLYVF